MFTFNDEYLLKSMMSLVRDESSRIVSLGLATQDGLKEFIEPTLYGAIKRVAEENGDRSIVLEALTNLHNNLNAIRLPGDFENISSPLEHQLCATLKVEIPVEMTKGDADVAADDDADDEVADDDADDESEEIKAICSVLERITYGLGKKGNHEAAYLVERAKYKIAALM